MKPLLSTLFFATAMMAASSQEPAIAGEGSTVDVVHFWISKSESTALDVYRQAWAGAGNRWVDLPAADKVAVQRIVSDRIANGYPPAVMQWNANEGSHELPEMGIVQDIDPVAQEDHWRDVLPGFVLDRITYKDEVYFAPSNIHAENWLWTSQKIFDELGLETPQTWGDIFTAADRIKAAGHLPVAIGSGSWEVSLLFNDIMYYTMGDVGYSRIIGADAEAVLDPRMLDALDMLRRLSRYAESPAARADKTWADATAMVGRGEAGMQFMGDWAKGELVSLGYTADRDFGCNLAPGTSIAYFTVIDAFAFPLTTREGETQAQQAFARMVLDPDNQVAFSRIKGSLPVRTDIDPTGLDRCGQLGLKMIMNDNRRVSAQSMAMPTQMSEGWIGILTDFFNDETMSSQTAQQRLYQVIKQG
ncbi:sugar ABC transporter substrate-binding protein [Litchfieldella qijiaojingensis]|uniref:Probable sugar-binding periplasmic protein n=1 Tax=Litchfieldella qijiaojingensis TaxID=980347 RepID=A0ABQ2YRU4_9GAMM|nr:ABC transporter substrate-binding protein [Halomonas qijiaojingensis]GGX93271.1 sugar ABC transporter substrate-binding protein [Halomonas qijiaojingensis]